MDHEHWFDRLNKALVGAAPRRTLLGAAAAVVASLAVGAIPVTEAARNRKKKRKKKQGNGEPKPTPPCSGRACAFYFEGDQDQIDFCEFVCRQCDGDDPREFCIVITFKPDGTLTRVADCCDEGAECCGGSFCCGSSTNPGPRCCDGQCVDTTASLDHCGGCNRPCLLVGQECVDSECRCPEGQIACDGACVDVIECPDLCQAEECPGPNIPNPCPGLPGRCVTDQNYVCCAGFRCVIIGEHPDNYYCCGSSPDDDPNTICKRFDEQCAPGKGYQPLNRHCSCDDPVCED